MFKVEKNIPIKARKHGAKKYPFSEMAIGDSFFVPLSEYTNTGSARSSLYTAARREGVKITVRNTYCGNLRVWRIE